MHKDIFLFEVAKILASLCKTERFTLAYLLGLEFHEIMNLRDEKPVLYCNMKNLF